MEAKLGLGKTWVANVVLYFLLFFVPMMMAGRDTVIGTTTSSGRDGSSTQKLEVQKLLKNLNKPALKSIKSPDGDIIDCIHILSRLAFDHPKLKSYKIQMRPNFYPKRRVLEESKVNCSVMASKWKVHRRNHSYKKDKKGGHIEGKLYPTSWEEESQKHPSIQMNVAYTLI